MRITDKLLRQRSEHNDGLLDELEEVALHQLEIEKIENLDKLCKHLKILLLQNNIIEKIENVGRLKELEYLNLALNNITKIENLQACECLKKLDLTVNFIDVDTLEESIVNLQMNEKLEDLYLMGNPCTEWDGWRAYVIYHLPQLRQLDGKTVTPTERIESERLYRRGSLRKELLSKIKQKEEKERERQQSKKETSETAYTRENRKKMYLDMAKEREEKERKRNEENGENKKKSCEPPSVYNEKGEIRQCNQGRYAFTIDDVSEPDKILVDIQTPKYLCITAIEADVNPTYIRVTIKNKVTQLRLPAEISVEKSKVQRCRSTGHLHFELALMNPRCLSSSSSRLKKKLSLRKSQDASIVEKKEDSQPSSPCHGKMKKTRSREEKERKKLTPTPTSPPCLEDMLDITGKAGVYTPQLQEQRERKKNFSSDFVREVTTTQRREEHKNECSSSSSSSTSSSSTVTPSTPQKQEERNCAFGEEKEKEKKSNEKKERNDEKELYSEEDEEEDEEIPDLETVI